MGRAWSKRGEGGGVMQGSEKLQVKGISTGGGSGMEGRELRRAACAQGDSSAAVGWVWVVGEGEASFMPH